MFKLLFFILLLFNNGNFQQFLPFIQSGRIELLGVVTSYDNSDLNHHEGGLWIFLSIIIPGLVKGNINASSNKTNEIFNNIIISRQDVNEKFENIFFAETNFFDLIFMCKDDSKTYKYNTTTGEMSLYLDCYDNSQNTVNFLILPNSTASLTSAVPVNCNNSKKNCTEGYCAMFERQIFFPSTKHISKIQNYYCPNDFINLINFESNNNFFLTSYTSSITLAGKICIELNSDSFIIRSGNLSFFWWVSCFRPNSSDKRSFYPMPDFSYVYPTYPTFPMGPVADGESSIFKYNYFKNLFLLFFIIFYYIN